MRPPSQALQELLAARLVFPHALHHETAWVSQPCLLLLAHPEAAAADDSELAFGFYDLDDHELQEAMLGIAGRVLGCTWQDAKLRKCRVEMWDGGTVRWFEHDGERFKEKKHANQETGGDQLRPSREGGV